MICPKCGAKMIPISGGEYLCSRYPVCVYRNYGHKNGCDKCGQPFEPINAHDTHCPKCKNEFRKIYHVDHHQKAEKKFVHGIW